MKRALLLGADYYGTLAAARAYGKSGVEVTMADERRSARGLFSRYVKHRLEHPPLATPGRLVDWLVDYGAKHPGTVLYPTNDHLAWLFAVHRERLRRVFLTYAPGEESLIQLLDKERLHRACADVGLAVPATHLVTGSSGRAVEALAPRLRWPVLVKPRTQVFLGNGIKGFVARSAKELVRELARFRRLVRHDRALLDRHPDMSEPLVQEYLPAAETKIFSVAGFATRDGELVARAAMKVLQRPRRIGIGLCFEARPMEDGLAQKLAALCRRVGYYGCFEAELIADGDQRLLIDFNPRFYSQMAFEIARSLSLPMMVFHAAHNDDDALRRELSASRSWRPKGGEVYCHKAMLDLVLTLQRLSGQMSKDDVERWRRWYLDRRSTATDAVDLPDDRMPSVIDRLQWAAHFATHPRSFVRSFVLNR